MKTDILSPRKLGSTFGSFGKAGGSGIVSRLLSTENLILLPAGFLLGRAAIAGGMMPFGFAFFAAASGLVRSRLLLAACILLGTLTGGGLEQVYSAAVGMLVFSGFQMLFKEARSHMAFKYASGAFAGFFLPQLFLVSLQGFLLYDLLKALFSSFVVFVLYFIFRNAQSLVMENGNKSSVGNEEAISIAITAALAVSGLGSLGLLGFSLKNVLCILVILIFSFKCGPGVGSAIGVAIGLIVGMSSEAMPVTIGAYAFCGLLSGIFRNLGKIGSSLGFVMGNVVLTMYLNGSAEALVHLKEVVLAVAAFMIIPRSLLNLAVGPFHRDSTSLEDKRGYTRRIRDITVEKLNKFSTAFSELSKTFDEISETRVVTDKQDISVLFDRVADRICRDCSLCLHCWDRNFYNTYQVMFKIVESLEERGRIEEKDIPPYFLERCERIHDFVEAVNSVYELFKVDMVWKSRISESRGLISQQLQGLAGIIAGLAEEINTEVTFQGEVEDEIYTGLSQAGIKVREVVAYQNKWGKYEVSILHKGCGGARACVSRIEKVVSSAVGKKMVRESEDCGKNRDGSCNLMLVEEEPFKITTGVARLPKHGSSVSGDSYTFMNNGKGKYVVALSDGMGSGPKAASQSKAAVGMLESFLESGFDKDTAIRMINSVLVLKSSEESYSTMDISVIDLFDGEVEFVKIGAAPTYIKKQDRVDMIKSVSLPVGVLHAIEAELVHKRAESGDQIIMVTDGIIDSFKGDEPGERVMMKLVQDLKSTNPQQIAEQILEEACRYSQEKPCDDLTVVVAKMWKRA